MRYLLIAMSITGISFTSYGLADPHSDSLERKRVNNIKYILEAINDGSLNTVSIFTEAFDLNQGSVPDDTVGYHDWLNLYLSQALDTLSEERIMKMSILEKRILCHEIYFQDLNKRLKTVQSKDIQIFPYSDIKDPKSFDRGYIVHESEAENAYVVTYPYQGSRKAEYVVFGEDSKIRSMAHVVEETGLVIGSFMFL